MSKSALEIGDKVHIITRRRFESDVRRHFVGEIIGSSGDLQEVQGRAFVFNPGSNDYKELPEVRTRVFSLGQEGLIVNKIPREVVVASLQYRVLGQRLVVTDGAKFSLDINEFGGTR